MAHPGRGFFTFNPRRKSKNLLLDPHLQLKLPAYLLVITVLFAGVLAAHGYASYARFLAEIDPPSYLDGIVAAQTRDFLLVTGALTTGYVLTVVTLAVVYVHRMVGPMVPIRRQVEAMKNGDASGRIHLRRGDAFRDVAQDLNELADILEKGEKP